MSSDGFLGAEGASWKPNHDELLGQLFGQRLLGPQVVPFCRFFCGEGSPTTRDYRKKGTLIRTPLLEDLGCDCSVA